MPWSIGKSALVTAGGAALIAACRAMSRRSFEAAHARRFQLSAHGIVPGAESIALDASRTHAVLLLHGFNDTPQSVAPLATALERAGWTVRVPLLPGHGRALAVMSRGRAVEWLAGARAQYSALRATHATVAICGQSMGAALAVQIASETPDLPALVLLSPFIGMSPMLSLKFALTWIPQLFFPYRNSTGSDRSIHDPQAKAQALGTGVVTARLLLELRTVALDAQSALPAVRAPTLYLQSREDNRVRAPDAERNFAALGAHQREQRWLTGCGHIIAVDYCKAEVARQTVEWFGRWAGNPRDSGSSPDRAVDTH